MHYNPIVKSQRQREILEKGERKETCQRQGNFHKGINGLLNRNLASQKGMRYYIQSAGKKTKTETRTTKIKTTCRPKILYPENLPFGNEEEIKRKFITIKPAL